MLKNNSIVGVAYEQTNVNDELSMFRVNGM